MEWKVKGGSNEERSTGWRRRNKVETKRQFIDPVVINQYEPTLKVTSQSL